MDDEVMLLYNGNHDGRGRFAPTDGGGSGGTSPARMARIERQTVKATIKGGEITKQCAHCGKMLNGPMKGQKLALPHVTPPDHGWSHGMCPTCYATMSRYIADRHAGKPASAAYKRMEARGEALKADQNARVDAYVARQGAQQHAERGPGMHSLPTIWSQPIQLAESADGAARSWIMLMPVGDYEHPEYGKIHFTRTKLNEFKKNFDSKVRKIEIAFDADHKASQGDSRSTGWLDSVQICDEGQTPVPMDMPPGDIPAGLWGQVSWTPYGARLLHDKIYRYFSPEFGTYTDEATGQEFHDVIIGGALTNRPFLKVMPAIALSETARAKLEPWYNAQKQRGVSDQQLAKMMRMGEAPMSLDEVFQFASATKTPLKPKGDTGYGKASRVTDYDPDDASDATAFDDGGDDDDATMDDGGDDDDAAMDDSGDDDSASYDDSSEDADSAGDSAAPMSSRGRGKTMSRKASSKGGGRKMSEGRTATFAEVQQLREVVARQQFQLYEAKVAKQLDAWESNDSQYAITPKFRKAAEKVMLSEPFMRLSEGTRREITGLVHQALSSAIVDLSRRGSSFDQEERRTIRGGKQHSNDGLDGLDLHDAAIRMAMQEHKVWERLPVEEKQTYYTLAESKLSR